MKRIIIPDRDTGSTIRRAGQTRPSWAHSQQASRIAS